MGAWSADSFGNDDAADWLAEFESDPAGSVDAAFEAVMESSGNYLEAPDGSIGIVASEVVAMSAGNAGDAYIDEGHKAAIAKHAKTVMAMPDIVVRAAAAILRIRDDDSELAELWAESESAGEWSVSIDDLLQRLKASQA